MLLYLSVNGHQPVRIANWEHLSGLTGFANVCLFPKDHKGQESKLGHITGRAVFSPLRHSRSPYVHYSNCPFVNSTIHLEIFSNKTREEEFTFAQM